MNTIKAIWTGTKTTVTFTALAGLIVWYSIFDRSKLQDLIP